MSRPVSRILAIVFSLLASHGIVLGYDANDIDIVQEYNGGFKKSSVQGQPDSCCFTFYIQKPLDMALNYFELRINDLPWKIKTHGDLTYGATKGYNWTKERFTFCVPESGTGYHLRLNLGTVPIIDDKPLWSSAVVQFQKYYSPTISCYHSSCCSNLNLKRIPVCGPNGSICFKVKFGAAPSNSCALMGSFFAGLGGTPTPFIWGTDYSNLVCDGNFAIAETMSGVPLSGTGTEPFCTLSVAAMPLDCSDYLVTFTANSDPALNKWTVKLPCDPASVSGSAEYFVADGSGANSPKIATFVFGTPANGNSYPAPTKTITITVPSGWPCDPITFEVYWDAISGCWLPGPFLGKRSFSPNASTGMGNATSNIEVTQRGQEFQIVNNGASSQMVSLAFYDALGRYRHNIQTVVGSKAQVGVICPLQGTYFLVVESDEGIQRKSVFIY